MVSQALHVWMNGELVGTWSVDRGSHTFCYDRSWLVSPRQRSLSLSLPISSSLQIQGDVVKNYFDNLLPDSDKIRARLGKRFKTRADTFGLLQAVGRDCVGAIQLLPIDATPDGWDRVTCEPIDEADIATILEAIPSEFGLYRNDDLFRISIAGAQEKTAFTLWNNQWCLPHGATPSTHIFKLPLGLIGGGKVDASDSVPNEWLCAQIMTALGFPVAKTSMASFEGQEVLIVERFDRNWMDGGTWIARLPQEDFCQALGVSPDMKYEQHGGPGMADCIRLLQGSQNNSDKTYFLLTQLAFFLMAAPDGHAKNYSIFLRRGTTYEMTPLYDILSIWPYMGTAAGKLSRHKAGMAMAVRAKNAHYHFKDIQARHWYGLAMKNGGTAVWAAMLELIERVRPALSAVEQLLPKDFPEQTWTAIAVGMRSEVERFQMQLRGGSGGAGG